MKKISFALVILTVLAFVACNKDEDIVIDNPEPEVPETTLNYKVIEYLPAPGQYINEMSLGSQISSQEEAIEFAENRLANSLFVSLGSWGGYIIVKFDSPIKNTGGYDFMIGSNSFDTSNEPGIVWVMQDTNENGMPDDVWYELRGSHFGEEGYERNYWVKYSRPGAKEPTPWEDSNGETGVIDWLASYHSQDFYYPDWVKEDSYTLYGSRLPLQAYQNPTTGVWTNYPFEWGYVDNFGTDFLQKLNRNQFRISDAITEGNEPVDLPSIDFIKVQTAINGSAGWLGENSTEVTGFFTE